MKDLNAASHWREVYIAARDEKKAAAALMDTAKDELLAALGDTETVGEIDGEIAVSVEEIKRTALSQTLLKKLYPDVVAECMETTTTTKVTIK